ncbi:hypothetical protein OS493_038371 [Desmophyllum pertusum]|uniref:OTU domain-containing protein n=1 Tax=Desmophyllum pertusum TaxID=174260 RepID=A0A9X0CJE0_9CNID|nr:hypothetical protein OS493_038371 [Desmophyllum pertusum]
MEIPDLNVEWKHLMRKQSKVTWRCFLKKWESQLSVASMGSITNLKKHIRKGCCSAIPAGAEDDCNFGSDMNKECLQRNLPSFGLAVDPVPGNGDCCFTSIVKELHKVILSKEDEGNYEFVDHLRRLGFQNVYS